MTDHARSFDGAAPLYAAARPDYPASALDWLLPVGARRVLDLGAGTGKLTRQLVDRGLDVVAVEPSSPMLAELRRELPQVTAHEAPAEVTPLPDADVDAVLVAQAFHWFDAERALPEIARVLRSGGRLGLLWNFDDDRVDWVNALAAAIGTTARANLREPDVAAPEPFTDVATAEFPHGQRLTPVGLQGLIQTHSFYLVQDEAGRAAVRRQLDAFLRSHPDVAGRESFVLPYVTRCWRATRR